MSGLMGMSTSVNKHIYKFAAHTHLPCTNEAELRAFGPPCDIAPSLYPRKRPYSMVQDSVPLPMIATWPSL